MSDKPKTKLCRACLTQKTLDVYGAHKYCNSCTHKIEDRRAKKDVPITAKAAARKPRNDKFHTTNLITHLRRIGE